MRALILKATLAWRLGIINIWRVVWYRTRLKVGVHPVQRVKRNLTRAPFFCEAETLTSLAAPSHWDTESLYFGWWKQPLGEGPPDWHVNPFNGARVSSPDQPWWLLGDFDTGVGDIKTVWEASRMDWVLAFAQRAAGGDDASLQRLNTWLADWYQHNPCYLGPNWKCGQEASIRVMHLLLAARFLNQLDSPEPGLVELVEAHLARIRPTLGYAIGQDNNHGTSEAGALFIGGDWCARQGLKAGHGWSRAGRRWLENRARRLIESDGGFSQHSVNYHRLMLDILSLAELWRRWFSLPAFSDTFYQRAAAATEWLRAMVDPQTGDAPNLGANDGANLLPLTDADYRDYRPAVQLAKFLFEDGAADASCERHLAWLGLSAESATPPDIGRECFHAKGYAVLAQGSWRALLRYPHYRFRPGHCDALHIDLWDGPVNLLRDAGSYSYNAEPELMERFNGASGHNTVQFDGREPMPKIGRFLRGAWLVADSVEAPFDEDGTAKAAAAYTDWRGARHYRRLTLSPAGLQVRDTVSGFIERAVLRWRLAPGDWRMTPDGAECAAYRITMQSDVPLQRLELVKGWESRYYLHKQTVWVLEMAVDQSAIINTQIARSA